VLKFVSASRSWWPMLMPSPRQSTSSQTLSPGSSQTRLLMLSPSAPYKRQFLAKSCRGKKKCASFTSVSIVEVSVVKILNSSFVFFTVALSFSSYFDNEAFHLTLLFPPCIKKSVESLARHLSNNTCSLSEDVASVAASLAFLLMIMRPTEDASGASK
jgi:hypothetical protein